MFYFDFIGVATEKKKRYCFNCGVKQIKAPWHKYLKEHYLCHHCGDYLQKIGMLRHKSLFIKTKKVAIIRYQSDRFPLIS